MQVSANRFLSKGLVKNFRGYLTCGIVDDDLDNTAFQKWSFISELNTSDITFTSVFHPYHPYECKGVAWFFAVHDKV